MDFNEIKPVQTLDVQDQTCPMPLIYVKRALEKIKSGEVLEVVCSYSDASINVSEWCQRCGHILVKDIEEAECRRLFIKKR